MSKWGKVAMALGGDGEEQVEPEEDLPIYTIEHSPDPK